MDKLDEETNDRDRLLRSQNYYRAITLNFTVGAEVLRKLVDKNLKEDGISLVQHLASEEVEHAFNSYDLTNIRNSSTVGSLDVTKLTTLLLKTMQLNDEDRRTVEDLRSNRNKLAHRASAELEDDTLFNQANHLIIALAKSAESSVFDIQGKIKKLKMREVVQTCCNSDRITVYNEYYMMKLVECPTERGTGRANSVNPMTIRFGLTKFTHELKKGLKNVGAFLRKLKEENVITDDIKREVELAYSLEDKVEKIILHLTTVAKDMDLLKACKCLRTMEPNGDLLATLVENTSDNGRNITELIDKYVKGRVTEILRQSLEKCQNKNGVGAASLHMYVERKLGQQLDFSMIKDTVVHLFGLHDTSQDFSFFMGLKYKHSVDSSGTGRCPSSSVKKKGNGGKVNYSDMKIGDFAKYLDEEMYNFSADCKGKFEEAILKEKISVSFYKDMSEDEMKEVFTEYIHPVKLVYGLKKMLANIQRRIGDQYEEASSEEASVILRSFDQPTGGQTYRRGCTKPQKGYLLVPRHEYRFLPDGEHYTSTFIAKEVVCFVAAYMNGRQNGTIHFGISKKNEDVGEIIGIPKNCSCFRNLDSEIQSAVQICFKQNAAMARLCIRPVQTIPVEDDSLVIEVDVVPSFHLLDEDLISIYFPPKGYQQKQYAIYDGEIMILQDTEVKGVSSIYSKRLEARRHLEKSFENENVNGNQKENRLKHMLTQGNKYVTPFFTPVVVSGKLKDCNNESEIRQVLDIEYALTSSRMVLDFDTSPSLREKVETVASSFLIKTAENLKQDQNDEIYQKKLWIHCNGYDRSPNEKERRAMGIRKWVTERSDGVRKALGKLRNQLGKGECKMIFLVFQANTGKERDPMFETARDCIINTFRGECIVIAENDSVLADWKMEFGQYVEDFDDLFVTEISWNAVSNICRTVFKANPDIACILPCADGGTEVMSNKEKQRFTDIELVSGEECKHELENLSHGKKRTIIFEAQERFYEGKGISWWNFYFQDQVGTRTCFSYHISEIEKMLRKGKNLVEEYAIYHHPAAGGTTLGWHLLWHFSQLSYRSSNVYRCCILKTFTEDTLDQLADFHCFKERQDPNPFIILLDGLPDEVLTNFKAKLKDSAYYHTPPRKIFCILLNVIMVPIHDAPVKHNVLTYKLDEDEEKWFNKKYDHMEKEHGKRYIDNLIGFNFMKYSFDSKFIEKTTDRLMKGIREEGEHGEKGVLKCLSLINAYGIESHPVPVRIFDDLMENDSRTLQSNFSYGLNRVLRERKTQKPHAVTWNVTMSTAMKTILTEQEYGDYGKTGLCIICQPLAKAVVENLKKRDEIELDDLVLYLLELVKEHKKKDDYVSLEFMKIVSRLFIERQKSWSNVRDRDKFSPLIIALGQQKSQSKINSEKRVVAILQNYFEVTDDPMIGQVLARYNISINEFEAARIAIKQSLDKAPHNSYLHDTLGQVFKSHMEFMLKKCQEKERDIVDEDAAEIIELAFEAIERFKIGQRKAIQEDLSSKRSRNMNSFYYEIRTVLDLLENFRHFQCYKSKSNLLEFLNNDDFNFDESSLKSLSEKCRLKDLKQGSQFQSHIEESLRYVEEREYQIKYDVLTDVGENVLYLHERFDRFYGDKKSTSQPHLNCPVGFAPLLDKINSKDEREVKTVTVRVKQVEDNIEKSRLTDIDDRDFIVYLGYKIILFSDVAAAERILCCVDDYRRMLSYSTVLIENHVISWQRFQQRPILETFLYFALLHWPTESRTEKDFEEFCPPKKFQSYLEQWREAFKRNHHLTSMEQRMKNQPKTFFSLGKGSPGNDIVRLKTFETKWKEMSGNYREPTARDEFWKEDLYQQELTWMNGVVNGNGKELSYEAKYPQGTRTFEIRMYKYKPELSYREVSFVVGFTWEGPTALYVVEKENQRPTPKATVITQLSPIKDQNAVSRHQEEKSCRQTKEETKVKDEVIKKIEYTLIKNAEESRSFINALLSDDLRRIVVCITGENIGEEESTIRLIVIGAQTRTGVYHIHDEDKAKDILTDGKLEDLFLNKDVNKVFHDVGAVSSSLINEYGILVDGTPVWDIEMVFNNVSITEDETALLKRLGFVKDVFSMWKNQNAHYSKLLTRPALAEEIVQNMIERGRLIWEMFQICERKLDEQTKRSLKKQIYAAVNSGNPEKIKEIKEARKEQAAAKHEEVGMKKAGKKSRVHNKEKTGKGKGKK